MKNHMHDKLKNHIGHNIVCIAYGDIDNPADICIECEDCGEVLVSAEDYNVEDDNQMHYYSIDFNPTDELAKMYGINHIDGFDDILSQTFYVKTADKIETKEQMKQHLLDNFKPSDEYNDDLVNCIYPSTANEIYGFYEIDGAEFESCCGVPA